MKKNPAFYASVIPINHLGHVLLGLRREDGIWTPPAGGANPGETPEQTAARELFEETGMAVKPYELQRLHPTETANKKICYSFLWVCDQYDPTVNLDMDKEVSEWKWFSKHDLPETLKNDKRRFGSVMNGMMKYHGVIKSLSDALEKGGPGSGQKGHVTEHEGKVINLTSKLESQNPFAAHLNKLTHGAVIEGVELRSGKPLYTDMAQATAHGYNPADHKEAANINYDKAEAMSKNIEKVKAMGKPVPKEMEAIKKFHLSQFKQHMGASERLSQRMSRTQSAIDQIQKPYKDSHDVRGNVKKAVPQGVNPDKYERCVHHIKDQGKGYNPWAVCTSSMKKTADCDCKKCMDLKKEGFNDSTIAMSMEKSVVSMGHMDSAEVDTAKFATEQQTSLQSDWYERMHNLMQDYNAGDEPRRIMLDGGDLFLVKVEDGLYSGVFKKYTETNEAEMMVDNAKVRIERMTIPSLVQFCVAKEWITPYFPHPEPKPAPLMEALAMKLEAPEPSPIIPEKDRTIHILELIDKLVN